MAHDMKLSRYDIKDLINYQGLNASNYNFTPNYNFSGPGNFSFKAFKSKEDIDAYV